MAREMKFSIAGREYTVSPTKVDRSKLYGSIEKLALDDDGIECQLVTMDESGTIIIPRGGVAMGMLSSEGNWVERSELKTVKLDGTTADLIPSSFSNVNVLSRKATEEELLDCTIKAFYQLAAAPDLLSAIGDDIYAFDYCYRDSFETTPAFLLVSEQELFLLTGIQNDFVFIDYDEISVATDDEGDEDDTGEIDFENMF